VADGAQAGKEKNNSWWIDLWSVLAFFFITGPIYPPDTITFFFLSRAQLVFIVGEVILGASKDRMLLGLGSCIHILLEPQTFYH